MKHLLSHQEDSSPELIDKFTQVNCIELSPSQNMLYYSGQLSTQLSGKNCPVFIVDLVSAEAPRLRGRVKFCTNLIFKPQKF